MINRLDIDGILDRYWGKAYRFVLITQFSCKEGTNIDNTAYVKQYRWGRDKLKKADADRVFCYEEESYKQFLLQKYEGLLPEQKSKLPPFEELYADIKAECFEFNEKRKRGEYINDKMFGLSIEISELVSEHKLKYCEPQKFFEDFYYCIGELYANDYNFTEEMEQLTNNKCVRPYDYNLRKPPYNELLPHLISIELTTNWHCTSTLELHKEFCFKFNEQTRDWLSEHYNGCYRDGLEDLAFYSGERLLFSQCTHEKFQHDYLERFD